MMFTLCMPMIPEGWKHSNILEDFDFKESSEDYRYLVFEKTI